MTESGINTAATIPAKSGGAGAGMNPSASPSGGMTYGRSRLLLGVSGVGLWVLLAAGALVFGVPAWVTGATGGATGGLIGWEVGAVALIAAGLVVVQAPFDLLGGYVLPRKYGRSEQGLGAFLARWVRGVVVYAAVYFLVGVAMLLMSGAIGWGGMVLVGVLAGVVMLAGRTPMARLIGGHARAEIEPVLGDGVVVLDAADVGFTGGISGVFGAGRQVVPARWARALERDALELALRRRRESVASGLWARGRFGALVFVWAGLVLAAWCSGGLAGTAGGVLMFGAVFTLWSFGGLLVLPTLSRRASLAVDQRLVDRGVDAGALAELAAVLDRMQDDEPSRPGWIEGVFHPIPNVASRGDSARDAGGGSAGGGSGLAAWDIARTAAFLGLSGLSPLGRAVHCNSGRPALWVYLPLD